MANRISGPGVGLPVPQLLYPSNLTNGEVNISTNEISLAPGDAIPVAAGEWLVTLGKYCSLQYLDPVTGCWTLLRDGVRMGTPAYVRSDGFNVRVANLTGCAVGAVVTAGGSAYVQSTTTITPSTGNSTWQAIVGGAVNLTVSVTNVGSGYGVAPLVFIEAPPYPGVQAAAVATIASGTVSSITITNQGAGYQTAPSITILANPTDPNASSITTVATARCSLTGTGSITAVLCTNSGAPVASTMSLTVAGAGTNATVAAIFLQTTTSASITGTSTGYTAGTEVTTNGGRVTSTPAWTNPEHELFNFVPRKAQLATTLTGTSITSVTNVPDGGLFLSAPTAIPLSNAVVSTAATITLTLGGANDTVRLQQL